MRERGGILLADMLPEGFGAPEEATKQPVGCRQLFGLEAPRAGNVEPLAE
jgi:hypothetical protein